VQSIEQYLRKKGSPLASYAKDFVEVGNKYGIDPRFLVAVSGIETSFGKAGSGLANPFGYMSAKRFSGPREVLELMGRDLTRKTGGYYSGKNTIDSIGGTWAPPGAMNDAGGNSGWPAAVRKFYSEMGGNPNSVVKGSGAASAIESAIPSVSLGASPTATVGGGLSPEVQKAMRDYAVEADRRVQAGEESPDITPILAMIKPSVPTQSIGQAPTTDPTSSAPTALPPPGNLPAGSVDSGKLVRGGAGGNWGGALDKALQLQALAGITPSSQKRSRQNTASGGVSDHWAGSTSSYAIDLPGTPGDGRTDKAAQRIVAALGGPKNWGGGNFVTTIGGYRYQVIWKSNVGGNHYDHIHVGVRKA
jgi:hypothetical protein